MFNRTRWKLNMQDIFCPKQIVKYFIRSITKLCNAWMHHVYGNEDVFIRDLLCHIHIFLHNCIVETWYRIWKFFKPSPIRPLRRGKNVTWEVKLFGTLDISMSWLDFVTVQLFPQSTSILPTWLFLYNVTAPHFDSISLFCYVHIQWNDMQKCIHII